MSGWCSTSRGAPGLGVNAIRVTREIHSEVAFIDLPGEAGWLGFRDVRTVSGKNVRAPGPTLAEVLLRSGEDDFTQARALLLAGARHNLGEPRTTNLPTVPLEFLRARHRWRYDIRIEGYDKVEGQRTAMVVLTEGSTPSMVRRGDGGDLMARVVGWIEPDTGRLWRAEVRLEDPRLIFAERHRPTTLRVHFKAQQGSRPHRARSDGGVVLRQRARGRLRRGSLPELPQVRYRRSSGPVLS